MILERKQMFLNINVPNNYMKHTSEIHTRMEGIPVQIMERMIELGIASNKTEAIRLALLDYNEHHPIVEHFKKPQTDDEEEKAAWLAIAQESLKKVWDNPKDETRYRKFAEMQSWRKGLAEKYKEYIEIMDKLIQEGSLKFSSWADNAGHIIAWWEFDSMESFAKLWSLDNWQKWMLEWNPLVDNMRIRLMRPTRMITEDLIA